MESDLQEILHSQSWELPVNIKRTKITAGYRIHWHAQTEFLFFESGTLELSIGSEVYRADAGDLVMIGGNELHCFKPGNSSVICLHISSAVFEHMNFSGLRFCHILRGSQKVKELFSRMTERMDQKNPGDGFFIMSCVYELLSVLIDLSQVYRPSERDRKRALNRDRALADVITYIEEHYSEELTTSVLAEKSFLSEAYFCRLFKSGTGESPVGYIKRFRVGKAAAMLHESDKSITEIAVSVGFSDCNYFSRVFRSFFGVSPAEYRNGSKKTVTQDM